MVLCGRDYIQNRPRVGATKRAGFIFIGYGIRKEGVTIYAGIIRRSKFKKTRSGAFLVSRILSGSSVVIISFVS